jgi:5-methylthioadenosine/S-adenosylhomocysteine deaminase
MTLRIAGGRVLRPDLSVERADVVVDDEGTIAAVETHPGDSGGDRDGHAAGDTGGDSGSDSSGDATGGGGDHAGAEQTLDAGDCLVVPGLVNAHTHLPMTLLRGYADDAPLYEWLEEGVGPVEAVFEPGDVYAGAKLGALELIRSGTTAFADMYFHEGAVVDAVQKAGLRARLGYGVVTLDEDEDAVRDEIAETMRVAREYDGVAGGRIRTAVMPHALTTVGEDALRELADRAREADLPLHFHANETEQEVDPIAGEHGVRPLEYADDLGMLAAGNWVAHAVHTDETEHELLAERDTAAVHCPAANMKLNSGMAPVQAMLDRGVTVGLGTDGAASNNDLDVFDEMRDAAMLGKLAADDASALAAETVVEMATRGSAEAIGLPVGHVEEGAPADLAVVDLAAPHLTPEHDIVSHLAYAARGSDVRHTICDGQVLMRDREVLTLDAESVRREAAERARAAVDRA